MGKCFLFSFYHFSFCCCKGFIVVDVSNSQTQTSSAVKTKSCDVSFHKAVKDILIGKLKEILDNMCKTNIDFRTKLVKISQTNLLMARCGL